MKFNETPVEGDFWNIPLDLKWVPVTVESPDIITEEDRLDMLFRLDSAFTEGGNDLEFNSRLKESLDWEYLKGEIFRVDLLSSACFYGPSAFFNFRTGRVQGCFEIGKFPESIQSVRQELEFISERYPKYRFFVTFFDNFKSICTLLIHNNTIKRVKTRTLKQVKYTELTDYTYGSSGCRHRSFLERYVTVRDNLLSKILMWIMLRVPDFRKYPLDYSEEQYFSKREAFELLRRFKDGLQ